MGYPQFLKAEVDRLKTENERLTRENEALKKMLDTTLFYGAWEVRSKNDDREDDIEIRLSSSKKTAMEPLCSLKEIISKGMVSTLL